MLGSIVTGITVLHYLLITNKHLQGERNVPLVIGLDFLDKLNLYVEKVEKLLCSSNIRIKPRLVRKTGAVLLKFTEMSGV